MTVEAGPHGRTVPERPPEREAGGATSAVDTEGGGHPRPTRRIADDRTTFVIAHRLSTVGTADRIHVLDDGRVVEDGAHEALLGTDRLYASFWLMQTGDIARCPGSFSTAPPPTGGR